jgi:colicin import membrane protein
MNDLIVIEQLNPIELFTGDQADPLLGRITEKAKELNADVTTVTGRKEIASMGYQVSRCKTTLDDLGKNLVADWKAKTKKVDETRKHIRDYLDRLKDEVRQPLTEWEEEQKRLEAERRQREAFEAAWSEAIAENDLFNRQREIERREAELARLESELQARLEAERLEREEAERAEQARQAEIARAEAERLAEIARAEREAEERREIERQAREQAKREAEEQIRAAEEAARQREIEIKLEAEQKERERQEEIARAERERLEAIERAEREKQQAIEAERQRAAEEAARIERERLDRERIESEKREQERIEAERKAANKRHRAKINREAAACLISECKLDEETAKSVVTAIATGKIARISIQY